MASRTRKSPDLEFFTCQIDAKWFIKRSHLILLTVRYDDIEKMIVSGPAGPLQRPLGDLHTKWSRQAVCLVADYMFNCSEATLNLQKNWISFNLIFNKYNPKKKQNSLTSSFVYERYIHKCNMPLCYQLPFYWPLLWKTCYISDCLLCLCVFLSSAPVCLEAGKIAASHFWLKPVWWCIRGLVVVLYWRLMTSYLTLWQGQRCQPVYTDRGIDTWRHGCVRLLPESIGGCSPGSFSPLKAGQSWLTHRPDNRSLNNNFIFVTCVFFFCFFKYTQSEFYNEFFVLKIQRIKYRNQIFCIRLEIELKYRFKSTQKHELLLKLWSTKWPTVLGNLHMMEIMAQWILKSQILVKTLHLSD